jgi:para-nitrobenzyl esterase
MLGADLSAILGAGHGFEIPFVFGHFDLGPRANVMFTEANAKGREQLAKRMMGYWAEFARKGDPGTGGGVGPQWQAFEPAQGEPDFMIFDTDEDAGTRIERGLLDMRGVLARMEKDSRLRTVEERCEVFEDLMRSSPLLDASARDTFAGGACKSGPDTPSR